MSGPPTIDLAAAPDGTVTLGVPPVAPAGLAFVTLPGVTLLIDPTDAVGTAHATVYDAELAHATVATLFGDAAADAVAVGRATTVPREESPELADVHQLGTLLWLDDNRPVALDATLLDLEIAVGRSAFAALDTDTDTNDEDEHGDGDGDGPLEASGRLATLAELARNLREAPTLPLRAELQSLLRDALPAIPLCGDDPSIALLAHERAMLRVQDAFGVAALTDADLTWLADQLTLSSASHLGQADGSPEPGVTTGGLPGTALSGTASLDWHRVPRGLLPAPEASVLFDVVESGTPRLEVFVPDPVPAVQHPALPPLVTPAFPPLATPAFPPLVASLRSSEWPLPLAQGRLAHDPGRRAWIGTLPITPQAIGLARAARTLDVDIRSAVLAWEPPNPGRARASAAQRWACRGFEARRLAAASGAGSLDRAGSDALRYAGRLWASVGDRPRAERCRALASGSIGEVRLGLAERWLLASGGARE